MSDEYVPPSAYKMPKFPTQTLSKQFSARGWIDADGEVAEGRLRAMQELLAKRLEEMYADARESD